MSIWKGRERLNGERRNIGRELAKKRKRSMKASEGGVAATTPPNRS